MATSKFYRNNHGDKTLWVENGSIGKMEFTFDKEHIYNLFRDYPYKLTPEEKTIFDKENPEWAAFFSDRNKESMTDTAT